MLRNREEEVLVAALKELVAQGWKADNGFRGGYLKRLEDALRRELPTTDIKATPNIQSKLGAWKKCYSTLQTILSLSGVGFNLNGDYKMLFHQCVLHLIVGFYNCKNLFNHVTKD